MPLSEEFKNDTYYALLEEYKERNGPDANRLVEQMLRDDAMIPYVLHGNSQIHTEISPTRTLAIRWAEDRDVICVIGVITNEGRIKKSDLIFADRVLRDFEDRVAAGKIVMASVNGNVRNFISRVAERLARRDPPVILKAVTAGDLLQMRNLDRWEMMLFCATKQHQPVGELI